MVQAEVPGRSKIMMLAKTMSTPPSPTSRPSARELTSVFEREHDGCAPFDQEEQNQYQPQRAGFLEWPSDQTAIQILRFVRDQDYTDNNREQSRYQGPPESWCLSRPVGCRQP